MVILTLIEREILQVFLNHISQMLYVSTFGNTADKYAIVPSRSTRVSAFTERHICLLVSPSGKSGQLCMRAFP
jgi:hypothetical protein